MFLHVRIRVSWLYVTVVTAAKRLFFLTCTSR